jgi:ABC-type uncharacterized transport system, periplasmic component
MTGCSERSIKRALANLESYGVLSRTGSAHRGRAREARLTVMVRGEKGGQQRPPLTEKGGHQSPPLAEKGGHSVHERGTPVSRKGDTSVPPTDQEQINPTARGRARTRARSKHGAKDVGAVGEQIVNREAGERRARRVNGFRLACEAVGITVGAEQSSDE